MPTTINQLIEYFKLPAVKKVKWNEIIPTENEGIYIVSLSDNPYENNGTLKNIPISKDIIETWIKKVDGFELDKVRTYNSEKIIERLSEFWLSDESIIYIGKAPLRKNRLGIGNRVKEYYKTDFGEKRPHSGGHWLKSLHILKDTQVYYLTCSNSGDIENKLLDFFINNVSEISKEKLRDKELALPFGNLELQKGQIKKHGLGKMKI